MNEEPIESIDGADINDPSLWRTIIGEYSRTVEGTERADIYKKNILFLYDSGATAEMLTNKTDMATELLRRNIKFRYSGNVVPIVQQCLERKYEVDIRELNPAYFLPTTPIPGEYVFIGHGTDTGKKIKVPTGCTYVVSTLPGDEAIIQIQMRNFMAADKDTLLDFVKQKNEAEISRLLDYPVHIYTEGQDITDIEYSLPAIYYPMDGVSRFQILPGGLYDIRIPSFKYLEERPDLLEKSYEKSIFPTFEKLKLAGQKATHPTDLKVMSMRINQSVLFESFPGIHFMTLCRVPRDIETVQLRRADSLSRHNTIKVDDIKGMEHEKIQEIINDPSIFIIEETPGDLQTYLDSLTPPIKMIKHRVIRAGTRRKKRKNRKTRK